MDVSKNLKYILKVWEHFKIEKFKAYIISEEQEKKRLQRIELLHQHEIVLKILNFFMLSKGQLISKCLLVSSISSKKRMKTSLIVVKLNSFVVLVKFCKEKKMSFFESLPSNQRSYTRWLYKVIYRMEMKFWAVLGSRGCREKKLPTAISMQLFWVFFVLMSRNHYDFF